VVTFFLSIVIFTVSSIPGAVRVVKPNAVLTAITLRKAKPTAKIKGFLQSKVVLYLTQQFDTTGACSVLIWNVRYYIDPDTGFPHISNHSVTEDEVEQVLAEPAEDRAGYEGARVAIGQTAAGRYLRVIYVPDSKPGSVFVITAYDLQGKALAAFRRRRRRRGK
jgi:hypothetical protein